jgi:hypothetical protein
LRRSGSAAQAITVGEVIGIRSMGKTAWTIGVVRLAHEPGAAWSSASVPAPAAHLIALQPTIASIGPVRTAPLLAEDAGFESADVAAPPSTFSDLREVRARRPRLARAPPAHREDRASSSSTSRRPEA